MLLILKLKRFWFVLLAPLAAALTTLARLNPTATERIYSTGIYPVLAGVFGRLSGLLPFSLVEWLILLLPLCLIVYITLSIRKIVKKRGERRVYTARLSATLLCLTGIIWFLFTALCGLNYYRESFKVYSGLEIRPSSPGELAALCAELAEKTNEYSQLVARDSENVMLSSFDSYYGAADTAADAYRTAGGQYTVLSGFCTKPKPVIFSRVMSRLDLVGIYIPFTFEANVNTDVPAYIIPSSMLHELAHFKGFMREDEANFISYLVCEKSGDADFQYSGAMLALIHSTNALYSADKDMYWDIFESLNENVRADFNANQEYWKRFEGPIAEAAGKVNDAYLKTNNQPAGVQSYGRMVDLLLAEYRQRNGLA